MEHYYADFHVHVGISEKGKWIKIPTSNKLTLRNILQEAAGRKGMQLVGIVDALSPFVREDLATLLAEGMLSLDANGGYRYLDQLTLLLGAEIETSETNGHRSHTLIFLPDLVHMDQFAAKMGKYIRNIGLSSQNAHMGLAELVRQAAGFGGVIIPAHVFTPHKSLYGSCAKRMSHILSEREMAHIAAIELGLSADTLLADRIEELAEYTFLSNSDAHSLDKIAREYNVLALQAPSFHECMLAFRRQNGRQVVTNFGLDPRLGKYHRTFCQACDYMDPSGVMNSGQCPHCGSKKIIVGVWDRIREIADRDEAKHPSHRPGYRHQVPLSFIPGLGVKSLDKLLAAFGTEMQVIHHSEEEQLIGLVGPGLAKSIIQAKTGCSAITPGGGGIYGKLDKSNSKEFN